MQRVSLRQVYRCQVVDERGRQVGWVDDVLFHSSGARAVGYSVRPHLVSGVIPLPTRYLALDFTELNAEGELVVVAKKAAWGKSAEKKLGIDWEHTVIWYGQYVETESGDRIGRVSDALFSIGDGSIAGCQLTGGPASDATLGKRSVPAEMIRGFSIERHALIVDDAASAIVFDGGAANLAGKAAGKAAVEAGKHVEKAVETTVVAAATATVYAHVAAKRAIESPTGQKTKRWLGSVWADIKDAAGTDDE